MCNAILTRIEWDRKVIMNTGLHVYCFCTNLLMLCRIFARSYMTGYLLFTSDINSLLTRKLYLYLECKKEYPWKHIIYLERPIAVEYMLYT
jgi:hypothetical protein